MYINLILQKENVSICNDFTKLKKIRNKKNELRVFTQMNYFKI